MKRFVLTLYSLFVTSLAVFGKETQQEFPSDTAIAHIKLKQRIQETKIAHTTRNIVDRVIDHYTTQNSTDSAFVTKNDFRLIVKPDVNFFSGITSFSWESSNELLPGKCRIISDPLVKVGLSLGYRCLSAGYSLDVKYFKKDKSIHNREFNISYIGQTFGLDYSINKSFSHKIKFSGDAIELDSRALDSKRWQLNSYYVLNHRKFSYPAAITQSYKQNKTAGSPLFGLSFYSVEIKNTGIKLPEDMVESLGEFSFPKRVEYFSFNLNAGYAHNWVTYHRHVLLHFSIMPDIGLIKKGKITPEINFDNINNYISYGGVCRISSLWQIENHYIGLIGTANFHTISRVKPMLIFDNYLRIGIFYGFRAYKYRR